MIFDNEQNKNVALESEEFSKYLGIVIDNKLRWLPRVIRNTLPIERELGKETYLISLKVFPLEIYQYGYC